MSYTELCSVMFGPLSDSGISAGPRRKGIAIPEDNNLCRQMILTIDH